jgi:acetoin utilization deacetylase AcuC-like enzyme
LLHPQVIEQRGRVAAQPWTLSRDGHRVAGAEDDARRAAIALGLDRAGWHTTDAASSDADLDEVTAAVHDHDYLSYLDEWSRRLGAEELHLPVDRSAPGVPQDTPLHAGVYTAAREGARTALAGAQAVADGARAVYALCRPPGHHAGPGYAGGYCFLNNAAVAAEALARQGRCPGVLDLDFHLGNGTAEILDGRPGTRYASVHAASRLHYPWRDGLPGVSPGLCVDLTEPPSAERYVQIVELLAGRLADDGVDALVVSLGFDTVAGDPHGGWSLTPDVYAEVAAACAAPGWPVCVVQEGGYHLGVLADCAESFARGLAESAVHSR